MLVVVKRQFVLFFIWVHLLVDERERLLFEAHRRVWIIVTKAEGLRSGPGLELEPKRLKLKVSVGCGVDVGVVPLNESGVVDEVL